ncbi:flagellar hook-length control protein FliK [Legionella parisiensis]|uniref:Flagellar hook-length control protein n=1 Tax=Legionella parisiensis TaxID=45071 RepID=A0A1E5JW07_9GAMM|nr:flagellar hook-length control protein FliK [Legionella parisiensis]KTD41259.1 putative flagellar hook-length control protein [Legionella parisiensis]OEH48699.1 Flagellar hook-length control protein [Legionella parisiensis]STX76442.1 flagellar hook-length control protein FliK [Legionella parisiensis]
MTDLSKAIANPSGVVDLFSNTLDGEILTNSVEKSQNEIQNISSAIEFTDPNAFISLLAYVVTTKTDPLEAEQKSTQIVDENQQTFKDPINPTIDSEQEVLEEKSEEQPSREMENNVAVSWINSQYYQHEVKMNQINTEQKCNLVDEANGTVSVEQNEEKTSLLLDQVNETQVPTNEDQSVLENIMTRDEPHPEPEIIEKSSLLLDAVPECYPDLQQIKNTSFSLLETAKKNEGYTSTPVSSKMSIESKESLTPKTSYSENKQREKETNQTLLFQNLTIKIDSQKENGLTVPLPAAISENIDGANLSSINNSLDNVLTHEMHINVPIANHTDNLGTALKTPSMSLAIPIEIDKPEWSKQFSDHIIWLGQQEVKSALIKINPEDLGPLEISIKVVNDSASVSIVTHTHQIRDIIEQSLPKLQTMLAEQGLNLSEVHIDSDGSAHQSPQQNSSPHEESVPVLEDEAGITPLKNKKALKGLVDYFA